MYKESLLKIALMLAKLTVAVILIVIGQKFLDVPEPETFVQFLSHVAGLVMIWFALDIDWNVK